MKRIFIYFSAVFLIVNPCLSSNVEISNFNLSTSNSQVEIAWNFKVYEEKCLFVIEKSENAVSFTSVDTVYTQAAIENYGCKDNKPLTGISYYRLRCMKLNGEEITSVISYIEVNESEQVETFKISGLYPVPFVDQFSVTIQSKNDITLSIKCHNLDGKLLFEMSKSCSKGCNTFKINDLVDLKNDSYYLTISDGYLNTKTTHLIKYANN